MRVKCAQIGVGRWGKNILRNLFALESADLLAISDKQRSQVEQLPFYQPAVPIYEEATAIMENEEIEALIIATPAASHFSLAKQALSQGKHVLVEKPLTLTLPELDELATLAAKKRLVLMEGHLLLYHPAVLRFKEALASGLIGELHHLQFRRTNLGAIRFEASVLWDVGPHDLSVLLYLMAGKMPTTLAASGRDHFLNNRDEVVFITANYQDGPLVNIHESWLDPYKERKVIAVGDKGMLIMDEHATDGKVKLIKKTIKDTGSTREHERFQYIDEGTTVLPYEEAEPLSSEISHFLACVQTGQQPRSNATNSRKVLKLLLQAQESLDSSKQ